MHFCSRSDGNHCARLAALWIVRNLLSLQFVVVSASLGKEYGIFGSLVSLRLYLFWMTLTIRGP